eukprot:scaffold421370_cov18-Prasinocladus_malaysianus.AAC.1
MRTSAVQSGGHGLQNSERGGSKVEGDPETRTLMIEDSGVGMTKSELMDSLGTIARSGTAKFAAAVAESKGDANLIGKGLCTRVVRCNCLLRPGGLQPAVRNLGKG